MELRIEVPDEELGPIIRQEIWAAVYDKLVAQIKAHRTTLIFVNTRRLVERVAHQLTRAAGRRQSRRASRQPIAQDPPRGRRETQIRRIFRWLSPRPPWSSASTSAMSTWSAISVRRAIWRSCCSGSAAPATGSARFPKAFSYPLTRDDLLQSVAAIRAVRQGQLDKLNVIKKPLDVLGAADGRDGGEFGINRKGHKGHKSDEERRESVKKRCGNWCARLIHTEICAREEFEQVLEMLSEGVETRRSRRSAYIHRDRINGMLRPRRGARLTAITNGGAIPDTADYDVIEFPERDLRRQSERGFRHRKSRRAIFFCSATVPGASAASAPAKFGSKTPKGCRRAFRSGWAKRRRERWNYPQAVSDLREAVASEAGGPQRGAAQWLIEEVSMPPSRRRADRQLRRRNRGDSRHGAVAGKDHRRALFRRGRRHAVDSSFALGRAHQPRLGFGAAQAFLREFRPRAASGGDRRRHLHFAGRTALVSVERCFLDAQAGDARRRI